MPEAPDAIAGQPIASQLIADQIAWGIATLQRCAPGAGHGSDDGRAEHRLEAELLLCAAAGLRRTEVIAWPERALPPTACQRYRGFIDRRCNGEPIAYILQQREFYGHLLKVTSATLIPRPETELLIDWALANYPPIPPIRCADLGTGSGAIALSLAAERADWTIVGIERSSAALATAATNRQQLGLTLALVQGDWLRSIAPCSIDLILANPPYIAANDPHLRLGDVRFEPLDALIAGPDGLDSIRTIVQAAAHRLKPGGRCAIEHGWNQAEQVRNLFAAAGLDSIATHRDYAGLERMTSARRPAQHLPPLGLTPIAHGLPGE